MTMHIEIIINGAAAHHVAVVNEGPDGGGQHRYRWVADRHLGHEGRHGTLLHRREAGAAALAAAVLAELAPAPSKAASPACTCTADGRCTPCTARIAAHRGPIATCPACTTEETT